jgi:Flp pilus assembly protein TadD
MANSNPETGLTHLGKTALPLIGRIGTIAGGIVSLLAVFETISGEIMTTISAFVVVAVFVVTAIVVFHQTTQVVDEKPIRVYSYSQRARVVSAIAMTIAAFFLVGFTIHFGANMMRPLQNRFNFGARPTARPFLTLTPERTGKPGAPTTIPTLPASPTTTTTSTPALPTRTLTVTPFPIDQMTDINVLLKLGNDAHAAKNHSLAVSYFSRALQIDATNALAQFGLGRAHFFLNNVNAAYNPLRTALELDPKLVDAHAYLGFVYDYRSDFVRARAEYEEFLRIAPRDHDLRDDVTERLKILSGKSSFPTLTPQMNPSPTATSPVIPPTFTPTIPTTKPMTTPVSTTPTAAK